MNVLIKDIVQSPLSNKLLVIVIICHIFFLPINQTAHLLVHIYITKLSSSLLWNVDSQTGYFIVNFPNKKIFI